MNASMRRAPRYPGVASGGASGALRVGDEVLFVGLTASQVPVIQKALVTKSERFVTVDSSPPRFREYNAECLHLDRVAACLGGVFVKASLLREPFEPQQHTGRDGDIEEEPPVTIGAIWASYAFTDAGA